MPLDLYRLLTLLAGLAACALLGGCDPAGSAPATPAADPAARAGVTDVSNRHFALAVQQNGRKVPLRGQTVTVRPGPVDLVFAFPVPDGVFVHASLSPDLYRRARAGEPVEQSLPLKPLSEFASSTLVLDAKAWQYWYYFGGQISKFTEVREIKTPTGRAWACKKTLLGVTGAAGDKPVPLSDLGGRSLYLVLVKAEWDASRTHRVVQARETLRIDFR